MRSLLVILLVAGVSYHFCDARSGTTMGTIVMPLLFSLSLIALALWLFVRMRRGSRHDGADEGASVSFGSGFGHSGD